jgi:prepilin-type N-terminal cleavage/methylation domain-containing protein
MRSLFSALYKRRQPQLLNRGFSMIELMVSIAIIVLVLTVTLTRQSSFNSAVLLRSEAFNIALAIREIQLGAVSAESDGSGEFRALQGVYFDIRATDGNPRQYILFRDRDNDSFYDSNEALGIQGSIDPRFGITQMQLVGVAGSQDRLSIVFERPNFDAIFNQNNSSVSTAATAARIRLGLVGATTDNCGDDYRDIEITSAGQISVVNC